MHFADLPVLTEAQLRVTILNPATFAALAEMTRRAVWMMEYDTRAEQRAVQGHGEEAARLAAEAREKARIEQRRREVEADMVAEIKWRHDNRRPFLEFLSLEPSELRCDLLAIMGKAGLSRRDMRVLRDVVVRERTCKAVARDLGVSTTRVSQLARDALRHCRYQVNRWSNQ